MEYKKFDILEFDNNKKYIIIDIVNLNNKKYLYLVSENEEEYLIMREEIINGESLYNQVYDKDEFLSVANLITENNKNLVEEILNEKK